jgi:hypothetical protein
MQLNAVALAKSANHGVPLSKRSRGRGRDRDAPFVPPEDWYEPIETLTTDYRIIVQEPGKGYRHAVSPEEVRARLSELPEYMLKPLEVVQLSSMTRKKQTFPCYGMQWGASLYLYPIEESLIECFARPPKPSVYNEVRMFGGRWEQVGDSRWRLIWTPEALRNFYLNNILMHELGHLLDDRNTSYMDRERYAEWFAIEHGYRADQRARLVSGLKAKKQIRRRHHAR